MERPLGWKPRRLLKNHNLQSNASDIRMRKWDGIARQSVEWNYLRRDPELWYPEGNCLVHLYGRGQSQRGPAFRIPIETLFYTNCYPLLDEFLVESSPDSPGSACSGSEEGYFSRYDGRMFKLYIPAPLTAEQGHVLLYHTTTRNFFAWLFGKSLVGEHLGGALVGLLNSMNEFRSAGEDNLQEIMDYMEAEGYADMRNQPDHALGLLFFAEHFHFEDLYIDAFAHCTGMNERLIFSPGFEYISQSSRALITRSRFEMDIRLDHCGKIMGSFLSDDLSDAHLGLSIGARAHLDKFRSFLHSHYIAKLGYYPPASSESGSAAFPKHIFRQMCGEFQKLYNYLVDSRFATSDPPQISQQGGICVLQSLQAIDKQHKFTPLPNLLPLLPEIDKRPASRALLGRRLTLIPRGEKMQPDPRLVIFSSLSKATNCQDQSIFDCTLVRAYRGFEKDCVFWPLKVDKEDKLSHADARKVRWILIYSILQTLLSATKVLEKVRDTQNVAYNLSVSSACCPPWKESRPYETLIRTQSRQPQDDFLATLDSEAESGPNIATELKPDLDYLAMAQKPQQYRHDVSNNSLSSTTSRASTVRKALSTLGNMPELRHPKPQRASYHEILVHGYGNGTNIVNITSEPIISGQVEVLELDGEVRRKISMESCPSLENGSSRWSSEGPDSPTTCTSSIGSLKNHIRIFLDKPMAGLGLPRVPSSVYEEDFEGGMQPDPLSLKSNDKVEEESMKVTMEVKVEYEKTDIQGHADSMAFASVE